MSLLDQFGKSANPKGDATAKVKAALEGKKGRGRTLMVQTMLLAKLYKDGVIQEKDGVYYVDMGLNIEKRYGFDYGTRADIREVLKRVVSGLKINGKKVKVREMAVDGEDGWHDLNAEHVEPKKEPDPGEPLLSEKKPE